MTPAEITRAFRSVGAGAREEIAEMLPDRDAVGPLLRSCRVDDLTSIRRGVARYLVCDASLMRRPDARAEIDLRCSAGAEIRLVEQLPQWIRMLDRRVAILAEPSESSVEALLIHEQSMITSLQTLFVGTWRQADGIPEDVAPAVGPRDREVLRMMSHGETDEVAARSLDVSVRTYRRHVAGLLGLLGATSRFQAGALAATRGWL